MDRETARRHLLEIYASAMGAVAGDELVRRHLSARPLSGNVCVVAVGKAAEAMAIGAQQLLGAQLQRGLLITKHGYLNAPFDARWECLEAGHPLPDGESVRAGARLLTFLHSVAEDAHLLFLISGGASSLVEVLPDGVTLEQLQQINQWLLAAGLDIDAMNRVRKGLSAIKAGRLAAHLHSHRTTQLLISDVPGSDPHVIGSGLLVLHSRSDLAVDHLPLPEWIGSALHKAMPLPAPEVFASVTTHLLASNQTARWAAQSEAQRRGFSVVLHDYDFQGHAELLGSEFARSTLAEPAALLERPR